MGQFSGNFCPKSVSLIGTRMYIKKALYVEFKNIAAPFKSQFMFPTSSPGKIAFEIRSRFTVIQLQSGDVIIASFNE